MSAWGKTDAVMNVAFLVVGSPSVLTQEGLACGWVPCLVAGSRWLSALFPECRWAGWLWLARFQA